MPKEPFGRDCFPSGFRIGRTRRPWRSRSPACLYSPACRVFCPRSDIPASHCTGRSVTTFLRARGGGPKTQGKQGRPYRLGLHGRPDRYGQPSFRHKRARCEQRNLRAHLRFLLRQNGLSPSFRPRQRIKRGRRSTGRCGRIRRRKIGRGPLFCPAVRFPRCRFTVLVSADRSRRRQQAFPLRRRAPKGLAPA